MSEHDPLDDDPNDPDEILKELDSLKGLLGEGDTTAAAAADADEWDPGVFPDSTGEAAEAAPRQPTAGSDEPGVEEWDLEAFLEEDEEPAAVEPAEPPARPPESSEGDFDTEPSAFPESGEETGPAAESPAPEAGAGETEDEGDVPVLEEVVFRGDDVPGEAVGLMSALSALPEGEPAEGHAETAGAASGETPPAEAPAEPAAVEETGAEPGHFEDEAPTTAPAAPGSFDEDWAPAEGDSADIPGPASGVDPAQLEAMAEAIVERRLDALRAELKAEVVAELQRQVGGD